MPLTSTMNTFVSKLLHSFLCVCPIPSTNQECGFCLWILFESCPLSRLCFISCASRSKAQNVCAFLLIIIWCDCIPRPLLGVSVYIPRTMYPLPFPVCPFTYQESGFCWRSAYLLASSLIRVVSSPPFHSGAQDVSSFHPDSSLVFQVDPMLGCPSTGQQCGF